MREPGLGYTHCKQSSWIKTSSVLSFLSGVEWVPQNLVKHTDNKSHAPTTWLSKRVLLKLYELKDSNAVGLRQAVVLCFSYKLSDFPDATGALGYI